MSKPVARESVIHLQGMVALPRRRHNTTAPRGTTANASVKWFPMPSPKRNDARTGLRQPAAPPTRPRSPSQRTKSRTTAATKNAFSAYTSATLDCPQ